MTDRKQALADLIEKVEAGTLHEQPYGGMQMCTACYAELGGFDGPWNDWNAHRAYHGHLDAAKALHEAVLPEQSVKIERRVGGWVVWLDHPFKGISDNPARAWLLAILKALHAQEEHA